MNSNTFFKLLAQLLKAASFFSALIGTANFGLSAAGGDALGGLGSLGWGFFFAATFWGQSLLINGLVQKPQ